MRNILILAAVSSLLAGAAFITKANTEYMKPTQEKTDGDGHVLVSLWKQYKEATDADRPQKQASVLESIIKEASSRRLSWDFYDASRQYEEVVRSRNWKLRDSLRRQLASRVKEYGDPLVTFEHMRTKQGKSRKELAEYVLSQKAGLVTARNLPFYKEANNPSVAYAMDQCLPDKIANDYEYALWTCILSSGGDLREDPAFKELTSVLGGSYPCGAYLEYKGAASIPYKADDKDNPRINALKELAGKYDGKAIGIYPKHDILRYEFGEMERRKASSDEFKTLLAKARALEKERSSFTGSEALLVDGQTYAKDLIETLNSKNVFVSVKDGKVEALLRNLPSVDISVTAENQKKPLFTKTIRNPESSFYVMDTVRMDLPSLDDGSYSITAKNGKAESSTVFDQFRLSLAARRDSRGHGVYVTDYKSGKPLGRADIELSRNGKTVHTLKDFALEEGFTTLPSDFRQLISSGDDWKQITAISKDSDGKLLKSKPLGINGRVRDGSSELKEQRHVNIYLDRGAYNPGDTVHFKAIFYRGDMTNSVSAAADVAAKATLNDSEGNTVETLNLTTNEFGSIAGQFALPTGLRNGHFFINVEAKGWNGGTSFTVDEFVLPSFDLDFNPVDDLYFPGDSIVVSGKVKSYSGHSLSGATVAWKVLRGDSIYASGSLNPDSEGNFNIGFKADEEDSWSYYNVNLAVTDGTGETREFNKGVWVTSGLSVGITLTNAADGQATVKTGETVTTRFPRYRERTQVLASDTAEVRFTVNNNDGKDVPVNLSWSLVKWDGSVLKSAECTGGETVSIDLSSYPSGSYSIKAKASVKSSSGKEYSNESTLGFVKVAEKETALNGPVDNLFITGGTQIEPGKDIKVRFGATKGPVWAVLEIFGENRKLLDSKALYLNGKEGDTGSLTDLAFKYQDSWPDAVFFRIFYFKDSGQVTFTRTFRRVRHTLDLPLSFSSFEDRTLPASEYTFRIKTLPGAECLAAVFDKSVETINRNWWNTVSLIEFRVPVVEVDAESGSVGGGEDFMFFSIESATMARGVKLGARMTKANVAMASMDAGEVVEEEAYDAVAVPEGEIPPDLNIREDFASTLAFEPFLRSDANGDISLKFKTSDKLSTYIVSLYAHTREMKNSSLRKEMVVSLPVKVSVTEPGYLNSGDRYSMAVSVSSNSDKPVSGKLVLYQYEGADHEGTSPIRAKAVDLTVPAGGSESRLFEVDVPEVTSGERILGLKAAFIADGFSDGVFVTVPVRPAAQVITESHSAVVLPGMDEAALLERIRSAFVNVSPYGAEYKEISIIDMVREAIPSKAEPVSDNVLDLSETFYVRKVAASLGAELQTVTPTEKIWEKILACRNADGGFSWFQGMQSSPVITAILLERFAKLNKAGLLPAIDLSGAVKFLDQNQFDLSRPYWCGGIGDEQYMLVRSLYPGVSFNVKPRFMADEFNKRIKDFRKFAKEYLVPGKARGMNGMILAKARRIRTLANLLSSDEGTALAKTWGVTFSAPARMRKSLEADIISLLEYAVDHPDGGMYYPNAVMPWRGLLESEAYAHSLICDLLTLHGTPECLKVADGIRIWLMLQKETQKWGEDPAFVDAIHSILEGSDEVKATKVILMTKTYEKPYSEIKATGNGFTIERKLFRYDGTSGKETLVEVKPGETVRKGEKLLAEYRIWNQENRSFVKVEVPREAAFRPVNQLSGHYGLGVRPLRVNGWYTFTPGGYRNVKTDRTQYFFDSYPEENTTIREEFFATQTGVYTAPVVTVESLYAPHYRANGLFAGELTVE
ncbi:MAG: hypothetical protein IJK96_00050 [Bacteroidales bacterium]|nr:hypothetical protein [Bacteroidales bacterium]